MNEDDNLNNMNDLRNYAIKILKKLDSGQIDSGTAASAGKLCNEIISTVKTQMEYAKALNREPKIEFMNGSAGRIIEHGPTNRALPTLSDE